jgi:hypothetical protein
MLQLTYISTATAGMTDAMVGQILSVSRFNNASEDVTGLLLYDGYRFLQALEGPTDAVNRLYQRVKGDPRHRAVVLLSSRTVQSRDFGNWAMAAERVAVSRGATVADLVDDLTARIADRSMQSLFRSFARVRAAA